MNIFCLSSNPKEAAQMMCDKHVVKMIIESCQMLSAVLDRNYKDEYKSGELTPSQQFGLPQYPKAHMKHPCTMWSYESKENYLWLLKHLEALCLEYTRRYGKTHKLSGTIMVYKGQYQYLNFEKVSLTQFVQAMPDDVKHENPIQAYRDYYNKYKSYFAKWKMGNVPYWYQPSEAA